MLDTVERSDVDRARRGGWPSARTFLKRAASLETTSLEASSLKLSERGRVRSYESVSAPFFLWLGV